MVEALRLYEEAKRIHEVTSTLQTLGGSVLMRRIGDLHLQQGDTASALGHLNEAHRVLQFTDSLATPSGAAVLHSLGNVNVKRGSFREARELYEKGLDIHAKISTRD